MIPDKCGKVVGQPLRTSFDKAGPVGKIASLGNGIIGEGKIVGIIGEIAKVAQKHQFQLFVFQDGIEKFTDAHFLKSGFGYFFCPFQDLIKIGFDAGGFRRE